MKIKSYKSSYLDKEIFSSVVRGVLWQKLKAYVEEAAKGCKIDVNEACFTIRATTKDADALPEKVKKIDELGRELYRVEKLNLELDKASKTLKLSSRNTENFKDYNTVSYEDFCMHTAKKMHNSLVFDSSSLADYTEDSSSEEWLNCKKVLAYVSFIVDNSVSTKQQELLLCFDLETGKFEDYAFARLNDFSEEEIRAFISSYNSAEDKSSFIIEIEKDSSTHEIHLHDVSVKTSMFKFTKSTEAENEESLLDFKYFNIAIFGKFIENLKNGAR